MYSRVNLLRTNRGFRDFLILPSGFLSPLFRIDEMPESEHRDTSCPVTPIGRYEKPRRHRWPDAIGIGFPKCGTGAMGFIDCHSKIVFREAEPYFWNSWIRVSNTIYIIKFNYEGVIYT